MMLIGLAGKARTGKDTAANLLIRERGYSQVSFAKPLKEMLAVGFGLNDAQLNGDEKETVLPWLGKSPRQLQQTLGTEWGRELVDQNVWSMLAKRAIDRLRDQGCKGVVISDLRFENEAASIREWCGAVIHIQRDITGTHFEHVSEAGIEMRSGDFTIQNTGSVSDYETAVLRMECALSLSKDAMRSLR